MNWPEALTATAAIICVAVMFCVVVIASVSGSSKDGQDQDRGDESIDQY